jgi:putative transposase
MIIRKSYKYRLEPNREYREKCSRSAGCSRFIFNHGLAKRKESYEKENKSLTYYDQNNTLPKLKKELPWLAEVHSQILQQSLKDLDCAFQNFFRRVKNKETPGFPKFKQKGNRDSFRYPQGVYVESDRVFLPKIGFVPFRKTREIEGIIKQTTVVREGDHWYVVFSCEIEIPDPIKKPIREESAVGIDVGLIQYATLAAGIENKLEEVENPRFLGKALKKLRALSKGLSRKVQKSQNWKKCKRKIARAHTKLANCRHNFAHTLSHRIVKNHDIICVESLAIGQMLQTGTKALSRSLSDAGLGHFLACLEYKAKIHGKHLVQVGQYFPSTRTCSCCGQLKEMSLAMRTYECESCGLNISRDYNSAIVLKAAGMSVLNACGATVGIA